MGMRIDAENLYQLLCPLGHYTLALSTVGVVHGCSLWPFGSDKSIV